MKFNQVSLAARLTRDPEKVHAQTGTVIGRLGIAFNDGWGDKETSHFMNVTCFGKTAEFVCDNLSKGQEIMIGGRLNIDKWEDKDGNKRSAAVIIAHEIQAVGGKPKDKTSNDHVDGQSGGGWED